MAAKGLKQLDMAAVLDVSIDRVKSLTSGRVKKLAQPETKALVEKLHVRGEFLATGEGPIFQSAEDVEFEKRLSLLREASKTASTLKLSERHQAFVRDILLGAALKQSDLLRATINGLLAEHAAELEREATPKIAQHYNVQVGQVGDADIVDKKGKKQ